MRILKKLLVRIILLIVAAGILCGSVVAVLGYLMYRDALKEQSCCRFVHLLRFNAFRAFLGLKWAQTRRLYSLCSDPVFPVLGQNLGHSLRFLLTQ